MFETGLPAAEFARFVGLNAGLDVAPIPDERRAALSSIVARTHARLGGDPTETLRAIPRDIGSAMEPFGWSWNGYYVLREDGRLHLSTAHGPPVCAELERASDGHGGPLSSGMCFDGLLLNQTLAAYDAKDWPGYVSCDAASGLATASGIVSPLRDAGGRPVAVWDLDATQRVEPADVRFVDVFFATLARCLSISQAAFDA